MGENAQLSNMVYTKADGEETISSLYYKLCYEAQ
jgi:hypothetical protein